MLSVGFKPPVLQISKRVINEVEINLELRKDNAP
jgi:hypothetical protein